MKQTAPKRWRVAGVSDDGVKVTLGRYETEEEAERDLARIVNDGFYRDVSISPIKVKDDNQSEADADQGDSAHAGK